MATFGQLQRRAAALASRLAEYSGLSPQLVENILQYAKSLLKPTTKEIDEIVIQAQMLHQFEITNQFLISQMIYNMKKRNRRSSIADITESSAGISVEEYSRAICTFLSDKLDIKINWVFSSYDTNDDGALSRQEMYVLLKPCVLHTEDMDFDEAIKDLIDIVMTVVDYNKNGSIDLEEFRMLVKKDILYIDLLGQVLPREQVVKRFLQKIQNKSPIQVAQLFENERARSLTEPNLPKATSLYPILLEIP